MAERRLLHELVNVSRTQESMTVLLNGQALVAGGESFDKSQGRLVPMADAELYKPWGQRCIRISLVAERFQVLTPASVS